MPAVALASAQADHFATVYAPLASLGLGTGNAAIVNQRGGRLVRFKLPQNRVSLVRNVACVACESVMVVDGLHWAKLPDGQLAWVKDVRDTLGATGDEEEAADPGYDIAESGDAAA